MIQSLYFLNLFVFTNIHQFLFLHILISLSGDLLKLNLLFTFFNYITSSLPSDFFLSRNFQQFL